MNVGVFYKAPKDLLGCRGFVSLKDGSRVELNSTAKLVLIYMLDRTSYFSSGGGKHFETQVSIGNGVGVEWKAAARALKTLVDHGVIAAVKERNIAISPHMCWYYKSVRSDVILYSDEKVVDKPYKKSKMEPQDQEDSFEDEFLNSIGG